MAEQQKDHYTTDELEALLATEQAEEDNEPDEDDPTAREEIITAEGFADGGTSPRFLDDESVPYSESLS